MLMTLSAMLDNFDTQMVDYMADIDMQAFSSDPWLHEEVKMEEDAPGLKLENFANVKDDQGDLTIEIDMEEHNGVEYDMVDDDQLHQPPDILDVEVYDASLAHSPAMGSFDSVLPAESSFSALVVPSTEPQEAEVATVPEASLSAELIAASVGRPALTPVPEVVAVPVSDSYQDASHTDETPNAVLVTHESITYHAVEPLENASAEEPTPPVDPEYPSSTDAEPVEERPLEEVSNLPAPPDLQSLPIEDVNSTVVAPDEGPPVETESLETDHASGLQAESTSSGDPHEISEGVYIDPPPAVLLSISSDDHEYEFSLFNEPAEWRLPSTEHHADAHRTLLHHLPTMYYESLYSLFEAFRQDEFIQSTFQLPEVELVLHAVDLALTISEDNIYSRDISLHDLNMLHDGSAIGGPLRTRLYVSSPRFIIQYQQLQEHVSRLQSDLQSRGFAFGGHTETHESHASNHQEVRTEEGEPATHSTEPEATETNRKKSEESDGSSETETHLPPQNSSAEQATDPHEEPENEDENKVGQAAEREEDRDALEEHLPTDIHPTVEDSDHTVEDAAVIGHDVVPEAEVVYLQRDEGEHDSEPFGHDRSEEGDGIEPEIEQELEDGSYDTRQGGYQVADGKDEVDQEPEAGADEQGDEISHEHSEYAAEEPEVETEPLPDQFQVLPQDVDDEYDQLEEDSQEIEPTTLYNKADHQDYNEEEALPELPTDPISFDDENWEQELDNADETLNDGDENSNDSSVTLSSRGSKRTYDEYESGGEGYDEEERPWEAPASPDPKRTRTQ